MIITEIKTVATLIFAMGHFSNQNTPSLSKNCSASDHTFLDFYRFPFINNEINEWQHGNLKLESVYLECLKNPVHIDQH